MNASQKNIAQPKRQKPQLGLEEKKATAASNASVGQKIGENKEAYANSRDGKQRKRRSKN